MPSTKYHWSLRCLFLYLSDDNSRFSLFPTSGQLLDRNVFHVEVPRVDYEKLAGKRQVEDSNSQDSCIPGLPIPVRISLISEVTTYPGTLHETVVVQSN
jgi:hypothetical protein